MFETSDEKNDDQRGQLKSAVDLDTARRAREATSIQIRKSKKEERLNQRRRVAPVGTTPASNAASELSTKSIPSMVQGVNSDDPEAQLRYTTMFRKLLSIERNPPIELVIHSGVVPRLVQFLEKFDHPQLQFEAAWALTNVASGTSEHTEVVINSGAVPLFVKLLEGPSDDVREQAVWALGNIAGDSAQCRNFVLQHQALPNVLKQLNPDSRISMLRNATWTLSNFCRGKPPPEFSAVKDALPALASLIHMQDTEVLADACWALSYLSDGPNEKIQCVLEAGVVPRCVELLGHPDVSVQTPALRTVGNIVTGNDSQTQAVLQTGSLMALTGLLSSEKKGIRKEACWTLSNITAGNSTQIQAVINANIFPKLINMLEHEPFEIKKEAAWAVSNASAGGTPEQIMHLVKNGCIKPLCDLLIVPDSRVLSVALEGIENVLKVGEAMKGQNGDNENAVARFVEEAGGLTKIENLQAHSDKTVYDKSMKILETYYDMEGGNEDEMAVNPTQAQGQFNFGGNSNATGQQGQFNFGGFGNN